MSRDIGPRCALAQPPDDPGTPDGAHPTLATHVQGWNQLDRHLLRIRQVDRATLGLPFKERTTSHPNRASRYKCAT